MSDNGTPFHHRFLIVGGGSAGISVAARLCRAGQQGQVAIVEPSDKHYYQPLWTLVGAGILPREATERLEQDYIPVGAAWIRDAVAEFDPDRNAVVTRSGQRYTYDFLVVAAGIQIDWDKIRGLRENIGKHGVCSNYGYDTVNTTWQAIRNFSGGDAVFTHPATPIKCGGAPQKIMYLAEEAFVGQGVRDRTRIHFYIGEPVIFKVEKYAKVLLQVIERKRIEPPHYKHSLKEIRIDSKEAIFDDLANNKEVVQHFDMIHVTPPQSSPDFIKKSPLANAAGFVDVDKQTTRHAKYANIFALGDCSSLPTSKTGAAIRKQAPVTTANLLAAAKGSSPASQYDGYTSCPLVTGYRSLVLAEFDYDLKPRETFPFDQGKERFSMYLLKRYALPMMYWKGMLKGRA